ncbi:unnamed protein product [Lota lota]
MRSDFARGSGNNSTVWQKYVDITFLMANCIILLGTSIVGIGANIFVTWAVYHQKSLRTWNNALLVNLAVIDFLRCAVDCPIILVIVLTVHQRGQADGVICNLQMASFSFSCCIQLVTLACISAERYQAIAHPFKITERKRRIVIFIPLTWTFAIVMAAVCVTFVKDSPVYVKCQGSRFKSIYNDTFGLYVLIPLWTACFALIIVFYASIFAIVTAHSRKIFDKGVNPVPKVDKKENVTEVKKADTMPITQMDKKQMTVESVGQVEKVEHCKSTISIMDPTGAPQKLTETVSVLKAPHHNEKVAEPTTETDKPPDEKLQKQPKLTPEDAKGDNGGCKTTTKVQVVEMVSSKMEKTTPLVAHPVIHVQEQLSSRDTEAHQGTDKVPGKGQDKIQIQESKSPAPVPVAPKGPVLPGPCEFPSKEPGVPEEPTVLPLLIDLEQGKINDEVVAVVGLPAADTVDNQDLCMVSIARIPAPDAAAAGESEAVTGAVCMMPSKASKDRGNKKKESKLAKRSGYIILTFLLFWLPLITTILVNVLVFHHSDTEMAIIQDVEILFISIACMTSLTDPIIYAAVNPQFRTEFYRLRNKLKSLWKKR